MSDCSQHKKDLFGKTDMKEVAEAIGDLHYETLGELFHYIYDKLLSDSTEDALAERDQLAKQLHDASVNLAVASHHIYRAWQISKPFMNPTKPLKGVK